jgi:hypothetical protein
LDLGFARHYARGCHGHLRGLHTHPHGAFNGIYMFAAYPTLALLLAAGVLAWFKPRWHGWVGGVGIAANLSLALYALFGVVQPAYAPPRSPASIELSRMAPLDATVGNVARVLGYTLDPPVVKGGQTLAVTVYWQPLTRTSLPYTVFVHLYDPSVGSIAQRDTYPGLGNWATTVWTPGRTFVDTYRLVLPAAAPSVSGAEILLGLYDEKTMARLPVTGQNAGPSEDAWVDFGSVQVGP